MRRVTEDGEVEMWKIKVRQREKRDRGKLDL